MISPYKPNMLVRNISWTNVVYMLGHKLGFNGLVYCLNKSDFSKKFTIFKGYEMWSILFLFYFFDSEYFNT